MYCSCFSCFVLFCFVFFLPLNVTKVRDFVLRKNFYISFADAEFDLIIYCTPFRWIRYL